MSQPTTQAFVEWTTTFSDVAASVLATAEAEVRTCLSDLPGAILGYGSVCCVAVWRARPRC